MGEFTDLQGSRCMGLQIQLLIAKLFVCLVWLSAVALAQLELSETVTGWVNFPAVGVTCLGNIALFIISLLRGRFYLEMGAGDVMATVTGPAKLTDINELTGINGFGMSTCGADAELADVVMLTSHLPNSSTRQFMKYIKNAHDVNSILLKCLPLKDASVQSALESASITVDLCECNCNCIVLWTVESITPELLRRMPVTLEKLSDALCLLPCQLCRVNGCHGCNQGLLQHTTRWGLRQRSRLTGADPEVELPPAVCEALGFEFTTHILEKPICICFPVNDAPNDDWTKLLMRSFKSKDQEDRGAIVMASDALENYLAESRENRTEEVFYRTASLVVPRLTEALINFVLTGWFKVDGFSSALVSRRAVRSYVVDSKGNGFSANAFLTSALVKYNAHNTSVCQVLSFRSGTFLTLKTLSFIMGCVNLICSIYWAVFIVFDGGAGKWYEIQSKPPSKARVAVIMAAVCIGLGMDCLQLFSKKISGGKRHMLWAVIILEIACIALCSAVAGAVGIKKGFGRWVYSALQGLVWVKWGLGSYLLGLYSPDYVSNRATKSRLGMDRILKYTYARGGEFSPKWVDDSGTLVYSSAFLFNAVLAGVQGNWK